MKSIPTFWLLYLFQSQAFEQSLKITTEQYRQGFNYFRTSINEEYCYFEKQQINWQLVKEIYAPYIVPGITVLILSLTM